MDNLLILQTGAEVPFPEARLIVHQPTIKEISMIGEESFWTGVQTLNFRKDSLKMDKTELNNYSDFDVLMTILLNGDKKNKRNVELVLSLLFPEYQIKLVENNIIMISSGNSARINSENYNIFKDIIVDIFLLNEILKSSNEEYNPADRRAEIIAKKLQKGREKLNKIKGNENEKNNFSILSQRISILSVGLNKSKKVLSEYTVAQLMDEYERYQKKSSYDLYIQAKLAGATGLEDTEHWML